MLFFSIILQSFFLLYMPFFSDIAKAETWVPAVSSEGTVNVRLEPSRTGKLDDTRLSVFDRIEGDLMDDGKWIVFRNEDGEKRYVMAKYMEMQLTEAYTVSGNGRVKWRKSPGGKRGGWYQPGDTVTVLGIRMDGQGNAWARIGENKYISCDYLRDKNGNRARSGKTVE